MRRLLQFAILTTLAALLLNSLPLIAQNQPPSKAPAQHPDVANRITIEINAGEHSVAVENASVYLKYEEAHKLTKDKMVEFNVKSGRDGVAHVPDAPLGRVLIQIVAEGWKTYGHWYEITDPRQVIQVHLEKPHKWY